MIFRCIIDIVFVRRRYKIALILFFFLRAKLPNAEVDLHRNWPRIHRYTIMTNVFNFDEREILNSKSWMNVWKYLRERLEFAEIRIMCGYLRTSDFLLCFLEVLTEPISSSVVVSMIGSLLTVWRGFHSPFLQTVLC